MIGDTFCYKKKPKHFVKGKGGDFRKKILPDLDKIISGIILLSS